MGHRDVTGGFLLQAHAGRKFQVPRSDWAISWSRCLVPGFTLPSRALIAISQMVAALTCTSADASEIAARASRFNLRLSESTIERRGCPAVTVSLALSSERCSDIFRQRGIKAGGDLDFSFQPAGTPRRRLYWDQFRDGLTMLAQHDLLSRRHTIQQPRQVSFGIVHIQQIHWSSPFLFFQK